MWLFDLDAFTFSFRTLFPNINPFFSVVCRICALLLNNFAFLISTRDMCVVITICVYFMVRVDKYLSDLHRIRQFNTSVSVAISHEYVKLWICIKQLENFLSNFLFVTVASGQIILTLAAWIAVKAHDIAPTFVLAMFAILCLGGIGFLNFILKFLASLRIQSIKLICCQIYKLRQMQRSLTNKCTSRQWSSHQPVPLRCGDHFCYTKESCTIYMEALSSNITNAILLIG